MLRRLAGPDGSQGASADNEVAVGQQQERESFGRRDEPEPGPTACGEIVTTWSLGAAEEPAGAESFGHQDEPEPGPTSAESVSGCLGRPPNTGVTAGSLEETARPSSASVVR